MSISIKLKNIYELKTSPKGAKLTVGSRIVKIKNKRSFQTPMRGITQTDLRAKNRFPEIRSIFTESPIFMYEQPMNIEEIQEFVRNNLLPQGIIEKASGFLQSAQHANLKMFIPSVTRADYSKLYQNKSLLNDFLDNIVRIQTQMNIDLITLPIIVPTNSNSTNFDIAEIEQILKKNDKKQFNIILDMGYEDSTVFEALLNKFLSYGSSQIPIISLKHKPPHQAINTYRILDKYNRNDVLFNIINLEKRDYEDTISRVHDSQFNFGDAYSFRVRNRGGGSFDWNRIKFFRKDLTIQPFTNLVGSEKLENINNDYYSKTLVKELNSSSVLNNNLMLSKASDYSRIHEIFLSINELKSSSAFFKGSSVDDYLQIKNKLKNHIFKEIV